MAFEGDYVELIIVAYWLLTPALLCIVAEVLSGIWVVGLNTGGRIPFPPDYGKTGSLSILTNPIKPVRMYRVGK